MTTLSVDPLQGDLLDAIAEADRLRDEGMSQAENAADPRVILAIDAAIARANASGREWSANDIRAEFPTTESQGLVGARVRAAAQRKEMRPVSYTPSTLPSTHGHPIRTWRGVAQ